MSGCGHGSFQAHVAVLRLTNDDGSRVTGYSAEIEIRCRECESPMRFLGVPIGSLPDHPTRSFDGRQLRAPLEPAL